MNNSIAFLSDGTQGTVVLSLSREGITVNPDIPVDDAAKLVLEALDAEIKVMVQKAVEAERESCAKVCEDYSDKSDIDHESHGYACAAVIRSRE